MTEIEKTSFLDEIVSIEDVGEIDTYDFTIPHTHCFVANGVVVHNSGAIEEKADAVLMLHYPHFYDKSEDMNELQVIVAKNRYGATGHAKLYVHPQYSRISDDGCVFNNRPVLGDNT
jgi:replicative DNA helicase